VIGTATRDGNAIRFAAGQETGNATISYQVADAEGAVSLGFLRVRITERTNVPPIAVADGLTIFGSAPTQFDVLDNDSDPDGSPGGLSVVSAVRESGDGTVTLSGSIVTIVPAADLIGRVTARYVIRDGAGATSTSTVTLTVEAPLNRPPDAIDDSAEVVNGGSVTSTVLFNDVDADGDPLTVSIISAPDAALGSASLDGERITFTAVPGAAGTAVIGYQISDGELTDAAVLRVVVRPCAESTPVAADAFLRTGYQQPIAVDLAAYGTGGTIVDVSAPAGYVNGVYTPPSGENGTVAIAYSVVNSCRLRASGRITIDVNQEPVAGPKAVSLFRGDVVTIPVTDIATDAEPLTITGETGAPAWVTTEANQIVLQPSVGLDPGDYAWTVTVVDPGGLSATVPIVATVRNRVPVAVADSVDASAGDPVTATVLGNDTDGDGTTEQLHIAAISQSTITFENGESGTVSVDASGRRIRIDPDEGLGHATFTYTVRDALGAVSAPATVTVVGPKFNRAPDAADQTVEAFTNQTLAVPLAVSDADGDTLRVVDLADPSRIVASVSGTTMQIRSSTTGTFRVTYRVTDGEAVSRRATLTVVVVKPLPPTTTTTVPPTTTTAVAPTTTASV
jgi:hypothetical protein